MPIFNGGGGVAGITIEQDPTALKMASNLSDLVDSSAARTNLSVLASDQVLQVWNNLSDLQNASTARTNLGVYLNTDVDNLLSGKLNLSGGSLTGSVTYGNGAGLYSTFDLGEIYTVNENTGEYSDIDPTGLSAGNTNTGSYCKLTSTGVRFSDNSTQGTAFLGFDYIAYGRAGVCAAMGMVFGSNDGDGFHFPGFNASFYFYIQLNQIGVLLGGTFYPFTSQGNQQDWLYASGFSYDYNLGYATLAYRDSSNTVRDSGIILLAP